MAFDRGWAIATNPHGRAPERRWRAPLTAARTLVAAVACLASTAAWGDFQEDYALGLRAIDQGDFAEARKYLERALAAQGEPVDKIILNGSVEQPYLPHHFLGVVDYKLGDCDAARAHFSNPVNRRMIARLNPIIQQERRLADSCKPRAAEAGEKPANVTEAPPGGGQNPTTLPPTPAVPEQTAPAAVPAAKPTTDTRVAGSDKREPAERRTETPAAGERPPPRLVRALEDYLAGSYAEAARIDPDALPQARARFHALLIRAAARYTIAQLGGDKAALTAARADAAAAFRLDPRTVPDEMVFSPAFRSFYDKAH